MMGSTETLELTSAFVCGIAWTSDDVSMAIPTK
jgi:hypothetical protein